MFDSATHHDGLFGDSWKFRPENDGCHHFKGVVQELQAAHIAQVLQFSHTQIAVCLKL